MKKIYLFILSLTVPMSAAMAQIETGRFSLGGASSFSFTSLKAKFVSGGESSESETTSNFTFTPQFGYFVADGFVLGLELQYEHAQDTESRSTSFTAGPYVKYYIDVESPTVFPFLMAEAVFGSEKFGDEEVQLQTSGFSLSGGIAIFVSENVSFDIGAGYASATQNWDDIMDGLKMKASGIGLSAGFFVFF